MLLNLKVPAKREQTLDYTQETLLQQRQGTIKMFKEQTEPLKINDKTVRTKWRKSV